MKKTDKKSSTPLNDFLVRLADPAFLDLYREDPLDLMKKENLTAEEITTMLSNNRGRIRVEGIKELERAGLVPLISNLFGGGPGGQFEVNVNITINSNSFTSNSVNVNSITINNNSSTFSDSYVTVNDNSTDNTTTTSGTNDWREFAEEVIDASISYFETQDFEKKGSLFIVGGGIRPLVDLTLGAEAQIREAEKVIYCVADPVTETHLHTLNPSSETLYDLYGNDKPRINTYREMLERIMTHVRKGLRVCAVFYGHPGVYAWATHQAIRLARKEGYRAEMSPGISAEDSLIADLGIDPSNFGLLSCDATDFLIRDRRLDPTCHVILWQIECVGDSGFNFSGYKKHNVKILVEKLCDIYPPDHPAILYDAAQLPHLPPRIKKLPLKSISKDDLSGICTLYLPPAETPRVNQKMIELLGFS